MRIKTFKELEVYKLSFDAAMRIFHLSSKFSRDERYSLTDQIRRSSRSVSANLSEAYNSRRYKKNFISKLTIAQCEAAETQTWLDFALSCKYIDETDHSRLFKEYNHIIAMIVNMYKNAEKWLIVSDDD
jgi:four helix bundle protein